MFQNSSVSNNNQKTRGKALGWKKNHINKKYKIQGPCHGFCM
jgi:hypothetical protein